MESRSWSDSGMPFGTLRRRCGLVKLFTRLYSSTDHVATIRSDWPADLTVC